ncbi:hypothetical protein IMZ31_23080 (plasmid) [Pontibacillus sp. ALD_SL1]|uniref:hypothetical protein n=1 Tax=Pontibacillus sp. ALD_SL1 TaxID=2777185 RepID=UPI001A963508|nr:hypothetical protein [Pontibacillus sp. ALD_SL1]QST02338.1 hypothetical protein IMZ31_23080 [Pontibacillus sp. ALD_SL1]
MKLDLHISDSFDEQKQNELSDISASLKFKCKKTAYHYQQVQNLTKRSSIFDTANYYEEVNLPIYYESENFLIAIRSSVDVLMHYLSVFFDLNLSAKDVNVHSVYKHNKIPKGVKNTFHQYTRPYQNNIWLFIYEHRNEIVHQKSFDQILPIRIDLFSSDVPLIFLDWKGEEKELLTLYGASLRFLENFISQINQSIKLSIP